MESAGATPDSYSNMINLKLVLETKSTFSVAALVLLFLPLPSTQAQFRQNSLPSSLLTLERAMALNPNNPIPRFHRAKVLEAMGRLEVGSM